MSEFPPCRSYDHNPMKEEAKYKSTSYTLQRSLHVRRDEIRSKRSVQVPMAREVIIIHVVNRKRARQRTELEEKLENLDVPHASTELVGKLLTVRGSKWDKRKDVGHSSSGGASNTSVESNCSIQAAFFALLTTLRTKGCRLVCMCTSTIGSDVSIIDCWDCEMLAGFMEEFAKYLQIETGVVDLMYWYEC